MRKNVPSHFLNVLTTLDVFARVSALCFAFLSVMFSAHGQPILLGDFNEQKNQAYNEFSQLYTTNTNAYYVSDEKELWTSFLNEQNYDESIKLGEFISVTELEVVGNTVYFVADDGQAGAELWKTNGAVSSTVRVKDIRRGNVGSNPEQLTNVNGVLYFVANNGVDGKEVWKSNGTDSGTTLVKDVFAKGGSSNPAFLTNVNGTLFFAANDGTNGYELWKSNGTTAGTVLVKDIRTGSKVSSAPQSLISVNGIVYFTASESTTGRELYKSDGSAAGTVLVKDIYAGAASSGISNMTAVNNTLFFTASDGITGQELWKSDGTSAGTVLVKDMTPGKPGSHGEQDFTHQMANFTNINGTLFYTAYQYNDYYVWKSDGTTAGTIPLFIAHGPGIGQPRPDFTLLDGYIYYFNTERGYEYQYHLYRMNTDGSNGQQYIFELYNDTYGYYYPDMNVVGNSLYFYGQIAFGGIELLRYQAGMEYPESVNDPFAASESGNPHAFGEFLGKTYFINQVTYYQGAESIFFTDGTPSGTHEALYFDYYIGEIKTTNTHIYGSGKEWLDIRRTDGTSTLDIIQDYYKEPAVNLTNLNNNIHYSNASGELWKIDGVTTQVALLKDFQSIHSLAVAGQVIVAHVTENNVEEIWRTNGQPDGTYKIKTIRSGAGVKLRYQPLPTATINGVHFFIANNGVNGNEVWRTQGATANTYMVADLNTTDPVADNLEYDISTLGVLRDSLYISAIGNDGQWALYKTRGASGSGVQRVTKINRIKQMINAGDKLYLLVASADNTASELWVTDGTGIGTTFLKTLPNTGYLYDQQLGNVTYFIPNVYNERNIWRTDGTVCGTYPFDTGLQPISQLGSAGTKLVFGGYTLEYGTEPYALDISSIPQPPCDEELQMASGFVQSAIVGGHEDQLITYPNPFVHQFNFRVNGKENEEAQVDVFTPTGARFDNILNLKCNTDYSIGERWPTGMYILKVKTSEKMLTQKLVKQR
ncbi:ELWxxDGT repeat protein [Chryseosolibacter indicus]|uniref:T9SS type A sorting domain-containing protein n=1 Tax=Chryseosolibacter indicus TaxID=2782351 RepID=A0ABS5VQL4_9BACT|nr:ELWxxDGT repeat protein [Chryseosolibacter indicus]MBT1702301.1 T9SS type A sorting domain-containing protein [Chryseosolibacter indicus]